MLKDEERLFCELYAKSGNMELSLAESGVPMTHSTAVETAYNLMKRDDIKEELQHIRQGDIATQEEVMNYLTNVLRGTSQTEENLVIYKQRGVQTVQTVTRKPNEQERLKSAQLLMKMLEPEQQEEQPVIFTNDLPEEEIIDVEVDEYAEPVHK